MPGGDRWATVAIYLIVLSCLAFVPGGLDRFALPKLLVLATGVLLALFARSGGQLDRRVRWIVLAGAGWMLVSALGSVAPVAQFLGRWPRYEGLIALPIYLGAAVAGARLLGPGAPPERRRTLVTASGVAAVILAVFGLAETMGFRPLGGQASARPGALLGNATDQGIVGILLLAVIALPALRERRLWWTTGAAAAGVTVVISGSRAAVAGALIALMILAVPAVRRNRTWSSAGRALIAPAVLVGFTLLLPATRARVLSTDQLAASTVSGRWVLWLDTLHLAGGHLLLGVGPSGYVDAVTAAHSLRWQQQVGSLNPPDSPHSLPLQALLAGGIPLLLLALLLIGLIGLIGVRAVRASALTTVSKDRADLPVSAVAGLVGAGTALLTAFTSPGIVGLFGLLLGALMATVENRAPRRLQSNSVVIGVRSAQGALILAVLILAGASFGEWPMAAAVERALAGRPAAADADFRTAHSLRPWDGDVALIAARTLAASGDQAQQAGQAELAADFGRRAVIWARQALDSTPDSQEAGLALAVGYAAQSNWGASRMELDLLLNRAPDDARLRLRRGVDAVHLGDLAAAETDFLAAARSSPNDPVPWRDLAIVYRNGGRTADADRAEARAAQLAAGGA